MLAILKRELKVYYTSLFAYVYYAIFFLVTGIFFSVACLDNYSTEFGYFVIQYVFYVMVVMLPFCTMKLFAMERKHKTDQLLFTAPVSSFSVLFAKYLATAIFVFLPLVLSSIYPIVISMHGNMSVRFVLGSYIGCVLSILVLLSIGMFVSTLTTNVVLAVVISYGIYTVTILGRIVESIVDSDGLRSFVHEISVYNKFYDMISGIVRSGDIIYLLVLTVAFFLLTWIVLESRRQNLKKMISFTTVILCVSGLISFIALSNTKVYDFTAEGLLSLSEETIGVVSNVEKETEVYYIGEESTANATYREFFNKYNELNDKISIHYKDNADTDVEFYNDYLSNVYTVNEASLVVVCGERSIYLDSSNYIEMMQLSEHSTRNTLEIESQLTSAIYYVNTEEVSTVAVISGHSEEALNSDFTNMLYVNGYELETVNLTEDAEALHSTLTDKYVAVIINAPQMDFSDEELKELEFYLEKQGNLVVVLDPLVEDTTNLFAFLDERGLEVKQGIVVEREDGMYAEETLYYLIPKLQENQYTEEIMNKELQVYAMTSKGIVPKGSGMGYSSTDLLLTSGRAFSKIDDFDNIEAKGDNDVGGPFSVASCAVNPKEGTLFLITSNVLFNEEADALSLGANRKFFLGIMSQLTGAEEVVVVDGKEVGNQIALYPYNIRGIVKVFTIIVVPVIILLIGILVVVIRNTNVMYRILEKKDFVDDNQDKGQKDELEKQE